MSVVKELIKVEEDGSISFGNYELPTKTKVSDFQYQGDVYKVKTYKEITRLEKNDSFVYESVPGTAVSHFEARENEVEFSVEGFEDAQITLELESDAEYKVMIDQMNAGVIKTKLGGKITVNVELSNNTVSKVKIVKC